jgi:hypothetical protein
MARMIGAASPGNVDYRGNARDARRSSCADHRRRDAHDRAPRARRDNRRDAHRWKSRAAIRSCAISRPIWTCRKAGPPAPPGASRRSGCSPSDEHRHDIPFVVGSADLRVRSVMAGGRMSAGLGPFREFLQVGVGSVSARGEISMASTASGFGVEISVGLTIRCRRAPPRACSSRIASSETTTPGPRHTCVSQPPRLVHYEVVSGFSRLQPKTHHGGHGKNRGT